jgi:hypothetical protein
MPQPANQPTITNPTEVFPEAIFSILVPLLMAACPCDLAAARTAAMDAVAAYNPTNPGQMVAAAQIIANGLIALDGLKQSIDPDLSIPAKLRLRGNAVALQRANAQSTKSLQAERTADKPAATNPETEAKLQAAADAAQHLVTEAKSRLERLLQPQPKPPAKPVPTPTKQEEKLLQLLAETPPGLTPRINALSSAATLRPHVDVRAQAT